MADDRRARLKRDGSESRKDAKSMPHATSTRSKPPVRDASITKNERKPSQSKVASTSRDNSKNSKDRQTVPQTKPTQSKTISRISSKTSQNPSTTPLIRKPRAAASSSKEPVIASTNQKRTSTVHNSLAKKVTLTETLPRTKIDVSGKNVIDKGKSKAKSSDINISVNKTSQNSKQEVRSGRSSSRLSRDRTRTRTLSPGESKVQFASVTDVGPDVGDAQTEAATSNKDEDQNYEDDYYESDFESDFESESPSASSSSSDEQETKPDNDAPMEMNTMQPAPSRPLHAATTNLAQPEALSHSVKLTPSIKMGDITEAPLKAKVSFDLRENTKKKEKPVSDPPIPIINFALARQRHVKREAAEKARLRGAELLSMIKLDTVSFTLLNLPPSKYEVLMSPYGTQAQTQTGEGKHEEEIQTETISYKDHWTQHPPCPDSETPGLQAVGPNEEKEVIAWPTLNYARLEKFLNRAAEVIFAVLSEENTLEESSVTSSLGLSDIAEGGITLGSEIIDFLVNRPATLLQFADHYRILTLHPPSNQQNDEQYLICVWSVGQPSLPRYILGSRAEVTSLCLHSEWPNFVIAGSYDGSLSMWNLQELAYHHPVIKFQDKKMNVRTPTFNTVEASAVSHYNSVVRVLATSGGQLISVDEAGLVCTWSLVRIPLSKSSSAMSYRLVRSNTMQINVDDAEVTDAVMFGDRLLVALDTGSVISVALLVKHANRTYQPLDGYGIPGDTSISVAPLKGNQFLVRDSRGYMRVHEESKTKAVWTSPQHELGDSTPSSVSWGFAGLACLLPGHVQLWRLPGPRPVATCTIHADVVSLEASPFSDQLAISTRDGKLYLVKIASKVAKITSPG